MGIFRKLFCLHPSWARAGWKPYSARFSMNYWICKDCHKVKNFGFENLEFIVVENIPINYDCTYETYLMEPT